jgi:hypothetical protein
LGNPRFAQPFRVRRKQCIKKIAAQNRAGSLEQSSRFRESLG